MPGVAAALGNCSVRCSTSHVPVVVPLPSRDGVMPREGLDGPERPPSLESTVETIGGGTFLLARHARYCTIYGIAV